nr:uncharacterized protein LOC131779422 [Pocillopora verrucosa]
MSERDRIDILTTLVEMATSQMKEKKKQKYESLLKEAKQRGTLMGTVKGFLSLGAKEAEQVSSDDDDDDDDDNEVDIPYDDDDDDDDLDSSSGSEEIPEAGEQVQQLTIQEEDGEELESEQEQEPDRIKIHEGTLTSEDVHWNIKLGAVHLAFPRDAVSELTLITVHRWKPTVLSPPLQEHEALVSNVIEISSNSHEAFKFEAEVKMSFTHSSPGLHGYELVLYKRIDNETGTWEEVTDVEDFKTISDFEEEYQSSQDIPNLHFPIVQADITECATYAVVSRLHLSPEFTITSNGGSFFMPEYPSIGITIPKKAVTSKTRIPLRMKVQEVPGEEFKANDILIGPILRIVCDETVEFLKPVTITLPVSLGDTHHDFPDPTACRVRILFLSSDGEQKEWKEITDDLKNPVTFDGMTVNFQVERFSGYSCLIDWCAESVSYKGVIGYLSSLIWNQPQLAWFFAYFPPEERPDSQDILFLICCPSQLREKVLAEIKDRANVPTPSDSSIKMIPGRDKAYVSLTGGIRAIEEDDMEEFHLQFISDDLHKAQVPIRVIDDKGLSGVKFFKTPKFEKGTLLCRLNFRVSPLKRKLKKIAVEFFGIPVNDEILSNPRPEQVLVIGKKFVGSGVYDDLLSRFDKGNMSQKQTIKSFYEALAGLNIETQDECFEALVKELNEYKVYGFVVDRLKEGKVAVCKSLKTNADVKKIVSEKVEYHWKNLARELGLEDGIIDAISVEQQDKCGECCYQVLQRWYEENGESATIRRAMVALTRIGLADINNDIVDCLNLRR